jgi:hypothetical protein
MTSTQGISENLEMKKENCGLSDSLSQHLNHNSHYPTLSITLSKHLEVASRLNISCANLNPLPAILVILSNTYFPRIL